MSDINSKIIDNIDKKIRTDVILSVLRIFLSYLLRTGRFGLFIFADSF